MNKNKAFSGVFFFWIAFFSGLGNPTPDNQGELSLTLRIRDNHDRPFAGADVEFVETATREKIVKKTDDEGVVEVLFTTGRYWQINVKDIRNYYFWQVEVYPNKKFRLNKQITYDYENFLRETRPPVDRSKLGLITEAQNFSVDAKPDQSMGIVKLVIKKADKSPLSNYPVAITCYNLKKTYTSKTNAAGIAVFKVPLNNEYEIDIDGIESYAYYDLPDVPNYSGGKNFTYEPTEIEEKNVNDTIYQTLPPDQGGTSGRVITKVSLKGGPDGFWRNEPVIVEVLGEKKWYRATTDMNGNATFLLPKGKQYMIHGRYEYNLDVLDFRRRRGIGYGNKTVLYRPQEKYQFPEKFIPKPEDVITKAFSNFLEKQYPAPTDQAVRGDAVFTGPVNDNSNEAILRLAFVGNDDYEISDAPPLNISFVIDRSGSMAGEDRIGNLKESLKLFVEKLRPEDIVSIVIFDDYEEVILPAAKAGANKGQLLHLISMIEANGGTNIFKGMVAGYKEVQKNYKAGRTNRVILLSDGYGVTPIPDILAEQQKYTSKGIECSTVGVGEDYNYALLSQMATNGGGHIEHVGDPAKLKEAFTRNLGSMLYPIAQDMVVEVRYNKNLDYKQIYGFPLEEKRDGFLKMKLRNVYSGLDQVAFLRFSMPQPPAEALRNEPVKIKLKYKDMKTKQLVEQEFEAKLEWSAKPGEMELVIDQNEKKMYAIAVMNQSLKVMSDHFHKGDLAGARLAIEDGLNTLKKVYPNAKDEDITLLKEDLEKYLDVIARQKK